MLRNLVFLTCVVCVFGVDTARGQLDVHAPRGGEPAWATEVSPGVLATRQKIFNLPFRMLPAPNGFSQPREVQLFISTDRGAHWSFYDRRRPFDGVFAFQASADGEYWFVSQIVDQQHRAYPQHTGPEARVIVDATSPRIQLSASIDPAGRISAQWRVEEELPASNSLQIEWRSGLNEPWRAAALPAGSSRQEASVLLGQTSWTAERPITQAFVRARIQDAAGNVAEVVQPAASIAALPRVASTRPTQPPTDPFNARRSARPAPGNPMSSGESEAAVAWPENEAEYLAGNATRRRAIVNTSGPSAPNSVPSSVAGNGAFGQPPPATNAAGEKSSLHVASHRAGENPLSPSVGANGSQPEPLAENNHGAPPPGEQPRVTNSRRLHLEYDVASVGAEGVAKVELWSTRDGGRSWRPWGLDPDRESPMLVALEDDGVFGFRIVITAGNGLAGATPQSGEPADLWVDIDSTTPTGRITTAKYGRQTLAGKLVIQWEAADLHLTDRPISLYHRSQDQDRWTPIVKGAANSGEFIWAVGSHIPKLVFLRLEIRDKAGNVGVHELTDPVSLEGLTPKGRIRGVRPVAEIKFEASRRRFFR